MQHYFKYPKKFTWKAFNKFDWDKQEILTARYDIILTDYETRNEKIVRILKKFNLKNLNKDLAQFFKALDRFDNAMQPKRERKTAGHKVQRYKEPNYSFVIGKQEPVSIWGKQEEFRL